MEEFYRRRGAEVDRLFRAACANGKPLARFLYTLLVMYVAILVVGLVATVAAFAILICMWGACERALMSVFEFLAGRF
jgi:hypothetical protein